MIVGLGTAFALFPDLDVASVPQRWFYRAAAALLLVLISQGRAGDAALLGLLALLPLMHRHRGWTHRWWAVPLVPLALFLCWAGLAAGPPGWAVSEPHD